MNQIQVLGIIRKNKSNIALGGAIQVPMLELDYLAEHGTDDYGIERIRVILDNPALAPWIYVSKGSLIYVIGKGIRVNGELVISASSILLVKVHTGKAGATLLFQYGAHMNQFLVSGDMKDQNELISDNVRVRGSLETYNSIPVINEGVNDAPIISPVQCLICGKPSSKGVII